MTTPWSNFEQRTLYAFVFNLTILCTFMFFIVCRSLLSGTFTTYTVQVIFVYIEVSPHY